eukprot:g2635.t1
MASSCSSGFGRGSRLLSRTRPLFFGRAAGLVRHPHFAQLTDLDVEHFRNICGTGRGTLVSPSTSDLGGGADDEGDEREVDDLSAYSTDWLRINSATLAPPYHRTAVLRPKTVQQVSKILKHCNARRLAVVPQGGNTGLVGGSVPVFDEVAGVGVFEAGCVLEKANEVLNDEDLLFPLDLGAKGSCMVGGNLSTNAGGLRLLRYGNLHGSCLGIEFVKADGTIVDLLSLNKKDNTGLDLKQLLIGAEGTLGVITKAAINCPALPAGQNVLLCGGMSSFHECVRVFQKARQELGEIMSAYEFFDSRCLKVVSENLALDPPDFLRPDPASTTSLGTTNTPCFNVLIETSGSNTEHDEEKLHHFIESANIANGSVAASARERAEFWEFRERIAEALLKDGHCYKYDVSVPNVNDIYTLVEATDARLATENGVIRIVGYGHMGDGNLHLNVTSRAHNPEIEAKLEPWLWEEVQRLGGSISAEHGVGLMKVGALGYSKQESAVRLMQRLKRVFDPNGILNPYKVIPEAL